MSFSVGFQLAQVPGDDAHATIPTLIFYPTAAAEGEEPLGPFSMRVAKGASPLVEEVKSLVLISHGAGGMPATHRELARYLASKGFVVGVPEHPGNSRSDNSAEGTVELLSARPRHLRTVADWFFSHGLFGPLFREQTFSIVGHSMGAYTGLALAGGVPSSLPHQESDRVAKRVEVQHDTRVDKLVLLAPAVPWFRPRGALEGVRRPILMVASYHDFLAPYFVMCPIVQEGVVDASAVDCRYVEVAGHYSFLSPWPEAMRGPSVPPSQDPPGFDRRAFLDGLYPQIGAFLERAT